MSRVLGHIRGDKVIWAVVILLSVFSLLTVYSSTGTLAYKNQAGNTEYYMFKHFIILLFGFLIMYLTHMIKFTYFSRIFQIALYIAVPLLILTLFVGLDLNEAKRVLPLPFNLTFQTSDLAKLTLIMYLARLLSKKQDNIKDFKSAFLPLMIPVLIVCGLILPANFSTAAMLFVTSLVLMFIGRVNMKYIFSLIGIGIVTFVLLLLIANAYPDLLPRANTWKTRIVTFTDKDVIDSDKTYQVDQAKIAIAEGGLIGKFPVSGVVSISLLTLKMIPREMLVNHIDVPPILISGRGWPVTGMRFTATAILIMAWNTRLKPTPAAMKAPKFLGILDTMRTTRKKRIR